MDTLYSLHSAELIAIEECTEYGLENEYSNEALSDR
jgi:hypothetical protein